MKEIALSNGLITRVNDHDFERVSQFKWHARTTPYTVYAQRRIRKPDGKWTNQLLHRFILGIGDPKIKVDHEDRNGLHNWRGNLRMATDSQNKANSRKYRRGRLTSQFRGVSWHPEYKKWITRICVNGEQLIVGLFTDEVAAALAYDAAARLYFGEFASCNFPPKKKPASSVAPSDDLAVTA